MNPAERAAAGSDILWRRGEETEFQSNVISYSTLHLPRTRRGCGIQYRYNARSCFLPMASDSTALEIAASRKAGPAARAGMTVLVLLSFGHFFIDLYSSALGALQPFLVDKLNLSLTQAGLLGGAMVFTSSVMQPVYGFLSDRFHTRLFAALAPAVAGIGISALGLAPGFGWVLLMIIIGGAGIASFHPQASALATTGVASGRGRSMAVFISAGTLGMALGPTYFSWLAITLGLANSYWAAIPGILMTILLVSMLPPLKHAAASRQSGFDLAPFKAVWKPLIILYFLVFIRSIVQITFAQLLPLYLHRERGFSIAGASYALSLYLTAGAIGGFLGGHLSDRLGGRKVILISMISCVPFLAIFFLTHGWISIAGLAMGGLTLLFTIPVNVVLAQQLAPTQTGTVSALMMGFAWGVAGMIFIPLTGLASDHFGMHAALMSLIMFPLIGFFLTLKLPKGM